MLLGSNSSKTNAQKFDESQIRRRTGRGRGYMNLEDLKKMVKNMSKRKK